MRQPNEKDSAGSEEANPVKLLTSPAHALSAEQVVHELKGDASNGLSAETADQRLRELGSNDLGDTEGVSPLRILIAQVANAMTMVLVLSMAVSYGIGSYIEGSVVAAVVVINIVVGFFQEFSAEKTMDSLRSLSSPTACVVRSGAATVIPAGEVVVGDLIEIKTGDTVPADIRLIEAMNLETDEALLTGESLPVLKDEKVILDAAAGPGDRLNVAYSSSTVSKGRGRGIVFATGIDTEIGSIAAELRKKDSKRRPVKRNPNGKAKPHRYLEAYTLTLTDAIGRFLGVNVGTPLQKKLSKLAVLLFVVAVICAIICLGANKFSPQQEVIIYAVATGLSMIPASLIVVLTITMANGTKRMIKRNVIVRNLRSIEALGSVTDICSDKTGTLTQGKMVVKRAWIPSLGTYSVNPSNEPQNPRAGELYFEERQPCEIDATQSKESSVALTSSELLSRSKSDLQDYLQVASLANLATVSQVEGNWQARGDPTEIAVQVFSSRLGWNRLDWTSGENPAFSVLAELPFDSDVKRMSVVCVDSSTGKHRCFTKGAVERVMAACTSYCATDDRVPVDLTDDFRDCILKNMEALARMGLRVLALASKSLDHGMSKNDEVDRDVLESNLVFRGLIGIYDPARPESAPAVRSCHEAGISVRMLTGDHPETARAIAMEVGILPRNTSHISQDVARAMVMTAGQFDALTDDQVDELPVLPLVIARCAPSTKVRMIDALHRRKKFCAMTGDGVNDSPSLRRADVGIAMGQSGSDVAKEASDLVLADDNFASIVAAIEEGRRIFDNIQKFILHVLAENIAQAGTLLIGLVFKDSRGISVFPLTPVEIIWVIMVTSGLPDMGLGFEPAVPEIMNRPPQNLKTGIFETEFLVDMVVYGLWITALCLSSFTLVVYGFGSGVLGDGCNERYSEACDVVYRARGTTFACLTWFALFLAWEMIDRRRSFFRMQPGSKRYLTQWIHDVWRNKFLFWAIVLGFITVIPMLYIPGLNTVVFKHKGISWEWGIVFVAAALFFAGVETWKWAKRIYYRRHRGGNEGAASRKTTDLEQRAFAAYMEEPRNTSHSNGQNEEAE